MTTEYSLLIIKPDGVGRGLVGKILTRFEEKGFEIVATKFILATNDVLSVHYAEHFGRDYYPLIESSMTMGPIFVFVLRGKEGTVETVRKMLGSTNPVNAEPGTIRGDWAIDIGRNLCHASDSVSSARREIAIWFKDEEIVNYTHLNRDLIYRS